MKIDEHLEEILKLAPTANHTLIGSHFWAAMVQAESGISLVGTIQRFPDELDYVNAQLHPGQRCGGFLESFFNSCLRADAENYQILRPVLRDFMVKYPASPERLEAERRDRGAS